MALKEMISIKHYWRYAFGLAVFTVAYNFAEGLVSMYFGAEGETLTLFGFGIDSFIEVISGMGILSMVARIQRDTTASRSRFERTALRITGVSFYLLAAGLGATALYTIYIGHKPTTTIPGLVISGVSIVIMWALVAAKRTVGRALNSKAILSDANCTMVCIYMSCVLSASSIIYEFTGVGFLDSLGALGLIYFSTSEGREAFAKAASIVDECRDNDGCRHPV